jgi:Carboxypeptidase regulatory-like domain/TonB-dependent Receptor Plug Domain
MTQGRLGAFVRLARLFVLAAVALGWGASTLAAQAATGKIEGRIRDQAGQPIANAQVIIVGTAYGALTNSQGYYFINNVPAGTVSLRGSFIGYKSVELQDLRVLGGQTISADLAMEQTPFVVDEITVRSAQNVLVPRDEVTTKQRVDGELSRNLPVDRLNQVLALQPGVVASASGTTISIRGGRSDEAATYLDGVPVTPGNRGTGFVSPAGNSIGMTERALEEASVTTGSSSAEFGNAQSGIVSLATRSGGSRFQGSLAYETDEIFPNTSSYGFNKVLGSLGGPLVGNLTFFLSGDVEGAQASTTGLGSSGTIGIDRIDEPLYAIAGVDRTYAVPSELGSPTADTTYVDVYNFAAHTGDCDNLSGSSSEMQDNYGKDCQGIRTPGSAFSSYRAQGKLNLSYGTGSRLSATYLRSQAQGRNYTYVNLYNPQTIFGNRGWNQVATLNWTQNLTKSTERALALDAAFSYQTDRFLQSPLTTDEEISTRNPDGGFMLAPLDFVYDFDSFPLNDELLDNYRRNTPNSRRSPYNLESLDQYALDDEFRNNAYGVLGFSESGGPVGRLFMNQEDRYIGKANLDWQFDRYNRIKIGGEYTKYELWNYSHQLDDQIFSDVWKGEPVRWNAFLEDRVDLGDVVVVGGLRYDFYESKAERPYLLVTEPTHPDFGEYVYFPRLYSYGFDQDPGNDNLIQFRKDESHDYLSPHIQVAFPVTDKTNFRLSYAHQVQAPDFGLIFNGVNTDLNITNTNHNYGADLDFGKTITFEFGIRHSFNEDMVLDISAYNKDNLSNAAGRLVSLYDPLDNFNVDIRMLTNADFGNTRGIDLRLDRRFGNYFNGWLSYTFQQAKNTGSDPFTYINFGSRVINQVSGGNQPPPQAIAPTNSSRPHSLAGAFSLTFPEGYREGTAMGTVLSQVGVFTSFRFASGTAFTRCPNDAGNQAVLSGQPCDRDFAGSFNGARLPSFKTIDMRFTKGFGLGGTSLTAYLDVRNILNFTNVLSVFTATNDTKNAFEENSQWRSDSSAFATEAANAGVLNPADGSMDLRFGGQGLDGCGNWVNTGDSPSAPNCYYISKAEERWGDGDGVFTVAEQRRASEASYFATRGLHSFTGPGRNARVGLEINF